MSNERSQETMETVTSRAPSYLEILANENPEFAQDIVDLTKSLHTMDAKERHGGISPRVRHLIWLAVEAALKMNTAYIRNHMREALKAGATPLQLLEALEVTIAPTGFPSFLHGFNAWKEVVSQTK